MTLEAARSRTSARLDNRHGPFARPTGTMRETFVKNVEGVGKMDQQKNLHKYIAMVVDPVQPYLASNADEPKLPEKSRGIGARYFHNALENAVSSAFPIVDQPGPLVLRLRSATKFRPQTNRRTPTTRSIGR